GFRPIAVARTAQDWPAGRAVKTVSNRPRKDRLNAIEDRGHLPRECSRGTAKNLMVLAEPIRYSPMRLNPERDRAINGHIREIFDFESGKSLLRVQTVKSVFPLLRMTSADNQPINQSAKVEFSFSDPAGNFAGSTIAFSADPGRWSVMEK